MGPLTIPEILQASAAPVLTAIVLVAVLRRSASWWLVAVAVLCGVRGAWAINNLILRRLPTLAAEGQFTTQTTTEAWYSAFIEAAIPEEFAKGVWVLALLLVWERARGHGALVGGLVGLAFALSENLNYAATTPEWRVMGALSHGAWGVILGQLLQQTLFDSSRRWLGILWAFAVVIVLHGLVDLSFFMVEVHEHRASLTMTPEELAEHVSPSMLFWMATTWAVDLFSIVWAVRIIRRVRRQPPGSPAENSVAEAPA